MQYKDVLSLLSVAVMPMRNFLERSLRFLTIH